MTELAAIDAQVVDIRADDRHKGFWKITLHIATERAFAFIEVLGQTPSYTDPIPVAVARLDKQRLAAPSQDGDAETPFPIASVSGRTRPSTFKELPRRTREAINACGEPGFRAYLEREWSGEMLPGGCHINTADDAKAMILFLCDKITSRSELIAGTSAAAKWDRIYLPWARPDLT